ncbi:MAG: hypothetical protein AB7P14_08110 [Blastocatellales bacterium]
MFKLFLRVSRTLPLVLIFALAALPVMAQKKAAPPEKKTGGATVSCDGALDIVPAKAMSFVRKRRPAKEDGKQKASPADSKSQTKKADDSKQSNR